MIDARNLPPAIQWHEGMLLAPHHFQQLSLRNEALGHYHIGAMAPFHWGVRRLRIDQGLLVDGILRISQLEAVMPDGLTVFHPTPEGSDLEVDLNPHIEEIRHRAITAHLAVPAKKLGLPSMKGDLPRYDSVEGDSVVDDNSGEGKIVIPRLRPRLSLLVTEKPPQKYTSFPLAKIGYINEVLTLSNYIPPTLNVTPQSSVDEICSSIAQKLRLKAVFLSEKVRSPSSVMKGAMVLETKFMIQSLVAGLPHFEAALNTKGIHPYALYLSLCSLVGHMAALGDGLLPPVLEPYDHNDLRKMFEQARRFIFRMIEEGILESHTPVPFGFENGIFSLALEETYMARSLIIGTRARPGMTEKDVMAWMEESLIGSKTKTESMKEKRILGAARKMIDEEGELIPARGACLFSVKADPEFIESNEVLEIFNMSDPSGQSGPAEIVLYVRHIL
ncbi:MAG: type VI secretion system baseplate subunit TssK [Deltaproteobacteria bacterium]|nr:type VI secretion system baseplate subunit TssK [Deltaproteobacteria bacterium]